MDEHAQRGRQDQQPRREQHLFVGILEAQHDVHDEGQQAEEADVGQDREEPIRRESAIRGRVGCLSAFHSVSKP